MSVILPRLGTACHLLQVCALSCLLLPVAATAAAAAAAAAMGVLCDEVQRQAEESVAPARGLCAVVAHGPRVLKHVPQEEVALAAVHLGYPAPVLVISPQRARGRGAGDGLAPARPRAGAAPLVGRPVHPQPAPGAGVRPGTPARQKARRHTAHTSQRNNQI